MKIAIAGFIHESNTFASQPTLRKQFVDGSWATGDAMIAIWKDAHHEMGGFISSASMLGMDLVPSLMACATPAGKVDDAVLDEVVDQILADCLKTKIDGLLLALHGAMVTERFPSADTEILRRLRSRLGDLPIISTLDFHGNIDPAMAQYATALVGYQTYPHIDQKLCGIHAAELMAKTVRGTVRPVMMIHKRPLLIDILGQATDRDPMKSLLARARHWEKKPHVLSVSVMAGFPWADVPNIGPAIIAVTDQDRELALEIGEDLSQRLWDHRHELHVPCPNASEAVSLAKASPRHPVVLVDLGDNIGGGSAGDGTVLLQEILRQKATGALVVLYAPEAVRAAQKLRVGQLFGGRIGGASDRLHGPPLAITGVIQSFHEGKWQEPEARHGGQHFHDQGATVVLSIEGGNTVVLNSLRTPPFSLGQLTSLGLDVYSYRILVVKAAVAHKAAYGPIAGRMIEVDTPGLTAINLHHFQYQQIPRPIYPLDEIKP